MQTESFLKATGKSFESKEKAHGRIETRTCYVTEMIDSLTGRNDNYLRTAHWEPQKSET
ncbi:hypothetical protein [Cohnella abietis]|uniref:Uncharacterized protein n=1 Tax=Cohnella abietis TaxID=2507935 RepID=A0A3T1CY54_9BACL|nr:hypothetical protein [Cohnella abietis]BBI30764.1 hypothetical protein KCTCHS21_01630 [Cohnella abietis]